MYEPAMATLSWSRQMLYKQSPPQPDFWACVFDDRQMLIYYVRKFREFICMGLCRELVL